MTDNFQHRIDRLNGCLRGMSGNSDRDHGLSGLPSQAWATPESSMEVLPSRGGRSLTPITPKLAPKGTIFTDLNAAHQAITARSAAPRSASNNSNNIATPSLGSVESIPSSLDVLTSSTRLSDRDPTVQHMELARADHLVNGRSLTTPHTPFSNTRHGETFPGSSFAPPNGTLPAFPVGLGREKDNTDRSLGETLASRAPRETGSTVLNIYKQYMPSESPSSDGDNKTKLNSEAPGHLKSPSTSSHDDEGNDSNYRLESSETTKSPKIRKTVNGLNPGKNRRQMYFPPTEAPQVPLPELPRIVDETQQLPSKTGCSPEDTSLTGQSTTSISDSQVLLDVEPKPLEKEESSRYHLDDSTHNRQNPFLFQGVSAQNRTSTDKVDTHGRVSINSVQHLAPGDHLNRGSGVSQCGISNGGFSSGGITSESDEDPFRYDRGSYNGFIKPLREREREVSVALHRMSSTGSTAHGRARPSPSPPPPTLQLVPPVPALPAQSVSKMPNGVMKSHNPFINQMNSKFYQDSVTSQTRDGPNEPSQVKITVQPPRNPSPPAPPPSEPAGLGGRLDGLKDEKFGLTVANIMSDGGDWETVGTDVGQFDSNRAYASDSFYGGSGDFKTTGSSIADYSDDGFPTPSFAETFSSGDRILQHPVQGDGPHTNHLRTLKDTGRPVFLPKPRLHQVNGYLQNSMRTFTGQVSGSSGTSATRYLADKLTAPFRSESFNKRRQNWKNPYKDIERPNVNFRDSHASANSFNYVRARAGPANAWKDEEEPQAKKLQEEVEKNTDPEQSLSAKTSENSPQDPASDDYFMDSHETSQPQTDGSFGQDSPAHFGFRLIPLHEAAKLEALRRESGEDVSFRSNTRPRMNSSLCSSPPNHSGLVAKPLPTYQRRPTTPFGIPENTESILKPSIDRTITASDSRIVSGLSSGSPPAPGRPVFPRSCRNPFSSVHGSVRSSSTLQNPVPTYSQPHLWPRGRRNQYHRSFHRSMGNDDPELRGIINLNGGSMFGYACEDASLSWEARRRREYYYYVVCGLCVLPFFALLVYRDMSNAALSWYTKGETCTLSYKQRRKVSKVARISGVFWLCAAVVLITVLVTQAVRNKKAM